MASNIFNPKNWSIFNKKDKPREPSFYFNYPYSYKNRYLMDASKLLLPIVNKIAIDVSKEKIVHGLKNEEGSFIGTKDSSLNKLLSYQPNPDQSPSEFFIELVTRLLLDGSVAVVPTEGKNKDIESMVNARVISYGPILRVKIWNYNVYDYEEIDVERDKVAVLTSPFFHIINSANSTVMRLKDKMTKLDYLDNERVSPNLDLLIKLPYTIKTELKQKQAEIRKNSLEEQLKNSAFGIGYVDGAEEVIQLNRRLESQFPEQIENLKKELYYQIGISEGIMTGSASELELQEYSNRVLAPILDLIAQEFSRKFIDSSKYLKEGVMHYTDQFKLLNSTNLAKVVDVFSRNEILSPNEIRGLVGFFPLDDPKAEVPNNSNMPNEENQNGGQLDLDEVEGEDYGKIV